MTSVGQIQRGGGLLAEPIVTQEIYASAATRAPATAGGEDAPHCLLSPFSHSTMDIITTTTATAAADGIAFPAAVSTKKRKRRKDDKERSE